MCIYIYTYYTFIQIDWTPEWWMVSHQQMYNHLINKISNLLIFKKILYTNNLFYFVLRHNLLGSLQRDSTVVHLHDVQQSVDEAEPSVLERSVQPGNADDFITAFSWHPTHDNRLLTTTLSGMSTQYNIVWLLLGRGAQLEVSLS